MTAEAFFTRVVAALENAQIPYMVTGSFAKVDLIMRKPRSFSRTEFDRRRPHVINGVSVYIASPEDVLIAKLEWAKMGESERQIDDAAGVIATQGENLDRSYVERWVRDLHLEHQWQLALKRAN